MTSRTSAHVPTAPCDPRLQRLAWFSPAAVVLAAVVWNVGAWAIDASAIAQPAYSFGVSFAAVIYSVVLGVPVLLLQALVAGVATWAPSTTRGAVATGAVVDAVCGFAMLVTGTVLVVSGAGDADVAFGVVTWAAAAVLLAPGWFVWDVLARR